MNYTVRLGHPVLILMYSIALLLLGCAIGLFWKATPSVAFCMAGLAALLMVVHDIAMGVLWFWLTAKMFEKARLGSS